MNRHLDKLWHGWLKRPYKLAVTFDFGQGSPVVLLHGIGRTGQVWKHLIEQLPQDRFRTVAFDLLGFGASPKPDRLSYTTDDHAQAVIAAITKSDFGQPVIVVGHSMGCLVAVRLARLRPDLVKHLVLYQMPLYDGLPEKRRYQLQLDLYSRFFARVMAYQPTFDETNAKLAEKLAKRVVGLEVDASSWSPFVKSLQHTIIEQTASEDIQQIDVPMDVIYGTYDMFVIRGKPRQVFGEEKNNIATHKVRARHSISPRASKLIYQRIEALENEPDDGKSM